MEIKKKKCHVCGEKIEGQADLDFKKKYNLHLINKHNIQAGQIQWEGSVLKINYQEPNEFEEKPEEFVAVGSPVVEKKVKAKGNLFRKK